MLKVTSDGHSRYPFCVTWREGGRRCRKYFSTVKPAHAFAARKRAALGLIPTEEPPATPEEFRAVIEARAAGVSLMDALSHWRRTIGASGGRTVADLVEARLAEAAGTIPPLSKTHLSGIRRKLAILTAACGDLPAAGVSATDLAPLVYAEKSPGGQKHTRAIFSGVFMHAMRMGWTQHNPAIALKPQRRGGAMKPVGIFTVDDAAEWLCCIAARAPDCLAGWAIALFAGLRRAEIERLDWSEVRLARGFIEVTAGKSKTRTRRLVDILPNLAVILEPLARGAGPVLPLSPKRAEAWARRAYGRALPGNAARHSFVSYHLALFGDVAKTELQAGHDRAVLFQHYRELVTAGDAEIYFTITV